MWEWRVSTQSHLQQLPWTCGWLSRVSLLIPEFKNKHSKLNIYLK